MERTATVERSSLIISNTFPVNVIYTDNQDITYECDYGTTTFIGYSVNYGDYVEVGDTICQISFELDEIELERSELNLKKKQESLVEFVNDYTEKRDELLEDVSSASDATSKSIAELELTKADKSFAGSYESLSSEIADLQTQIEEQKLLLNTTEIKAEVSGYVAYEKRYSAGDIIYSGTTFMVLNNTENYTLALDDSSHVARYGEQITLTDKEGNTYKGHVVSCTGSGLSEGLASDYAYIKADDVIPGSALGDLNATYDTLHFEDILTISADAVMTDSHGSYIYAYEDGIQTKTYFHAARTVKNICYIADGLTEGTVAVIK